MQMAKVRQELIDLDELPPVGEKHYDPLPRNNPWLLSNYDDNGVLWVFMDGIFQEAVGTDWDFD